MRDAIHKVAFAYQWSLDDIALAFARSMTDRIREYEHRMGRVPPCGMHPFLYCTQEDRDMPNRDAYYNAQTDAIIRAMRADNIELLQQHTKAVLAALNPAAAVALPPIDPSTGHHVVGLPTIPPPQPTGWTWTGSMSAGGWVEGWVKIANLQPSTPAT